MEKILMIFRSVLELPYHIYRAIVVKVGKVGRMPTSSVAVQNYQ